MRLEDAIAKIASNPVGLFMLIPPTIALIFLGGFIQWCEEHIRR